MLALQLKPQDFKAFYNDKAKAEYSLLQSRRLFVRGAPNKSIKGSTALGHPRFGRHNIDYMKDVNHLGSKERPRGKICRSWRHRAVISRRECRLRAARDGDLEGGKAKGMGTDGAIHDKSKGRGVEWRWVVKVEINFTSTSC